MKTELRNPKNVRCATRLRNTEHASRSAPFVIRHSSFVICSAFSLIELLVVIAVIAILAAMVIPITAAVHAARTKSRAKAELAQIETAIERYKAKLGHYPPDNPGNPATN